MDRTGDGAAKAGSGVFFLRFIYFWLHWVFVAVHRLSLVAASGGYFLVAVLGLLIAVAFLVAEHGLWDSQASAAAAHELSGCGSRALEHRPGSCGAHPRLLRSMWFLPWSGLKPMCPALAGGLFTAELPGKPSKLFSNYSVLLSSLEKAMAPHSSTLAWKIPWTKEPDGLQSMGSLRVGHD